MTVRDRLRVLWIRWQWRNRGGFGAWMLDDMENRLARHRENIRMIESGQAFRNWQERGR